MPAPLLASSSPSRRIFSKPLRATWTILESMSVRRSHRGFIQPSSTRCLEGNGAHREKNIYLPFLYVHINYHPIQTFFLFYREDLHLICSAEPPEVALVMAQAASFLVRNSATCRIVMRGCRRSASITIYKQRNVQLVLYILSYHI